MTGRTGASLTGPTGAAGEIRYRIPDPLGSTVWCILGTWNTNVADNRTCTLRISSQTWVSSVQHFRSALLQLSSGNFLQPPRTAQDGSNFYGWAELQLTSNWPSATSDFFIEQVGQPDVATLWYLFVV